MESEHLIEALTKLNIDSNERIGRVNEIVANLTQSTLEMQKIIVAERERTERLTDIYDRHLTQLEENRNLTIKECQQLRDHCDKITEMMERCQKMQSKILDALSDVTKKVGSGTNISIGDDNNI